MFTPTSFKSIIASQRHHPSEYLWRRCLSINSQFCKAVVAARYLTWEQMVSAACRYRLGASKQGGVIFWQIDQEERVRDGKVMYYQTDCHRDKQHNPTWVSTLLRQRDPFPNSPHETSHCFFGLHLISPLKLGGVRGGLKERLFLRPDGSKRPEVERRPSPSNSGGETAIAVVEAEKTAFILSEVYPKYVWLAAGGLGEVQVEKFRPLRGHKVVLFPDTDPDGAAFKRWSGAATLVMQQPFWEDSPPIRVSPVLELHASPSQKSRKIDLVDFIFEF